MKTGSACGESVSGGRKRQGRCSIRPPNFSPGWQRKSRHRGVVMAFVLHSRPLPKEKVTPRMLAAAG